MTPIEKNVIVVDEQGNILEATYPKRAKGLVKKGRARFISESTICLACPPKNTEENEMKNEKNKFENIEALIDKSLSENTHLEDKEPLLSTVEDPKFLAAVELAVKSGEISVSLLQRRLVIGFAKAACILDAMEALGLISAPKKMRPREIFPAAAEYLAYKAN